MDDGNDDSVLFGNIARSHSTRAVDYRYKSWGTYGFYWKVNRVPHVQFSLKEKKSVPHVQFSSKQKKHAARAVFFERKNVRHVLYLLKGKKARAIDSCTFLISLVGR